MAEPGSSLAIEENVALAPFTSIGVGGPARFLARARSEEHILQSLLFAEKRGCPVFVLGGGSNILISDSGFPGLVVKVELGGIRAAADGRVSAAAGEDLDTLIRLCIDKNLAGLECLSGIPGTVGGAPIQNVGAYGDEAGEVISLVRVFDRRSNRILELGASDCRFGYRSSIFNTEERERYIILEVEFALRPGGTPHLRYEELRRRFAARSSIPSVGEVRDAVLQIRRSKAMVLSENDPDSRSVGSFFKNPVLDSDQADRVEQAARRRGLLRTSERIPRFVIGPGKQKLPAAWLIERAGFSKGYCCGRAAISGKHALALINRGGASAEEILTLMQRIQERVRETFEIDLRPEPVFVGF